ncbi:hypothetical protein IU485_27795 [Nocardia cyriacigeorgica]|uniref:hypothetical protein n=1 Tax=Nocardia cyriacigeorgica TaxID=135487 RepID=UPI001893DEA5|nr:hypothetical protein [Nocardia cyriacigeorgica]MBF6085181.1 hypothetical protein [Nocardia cyriacigeorgica]
MHDMTLAQAVGEAPMPGLVFVPGVDFDPYDEEDRAAVALAMERDMADRLRAADRSNRQLREQLEEAAEEIARLRARLGDE